MDQAEPKKTEDDDNKAKVISGKMELATRIERATFVLRIDQWWPKLETRLQKIPAAVPQPEVSELRSFCQRVIGQWWSLGANPGSVGFVRIELDETTTTPRLEGRVYGLDGNTIASFDTVASCINLKRKKVYYYWEGWWTEKPLERNEGFGEISFYDSMNRFDTGMGVFFDTNLTDVRSTTKKSSDFLRCTEREAQVMQGTNRKEIGRLVLEKLTGYQNENLVNTETLS